VYSFFDLLNLISRIFGSVLGALLYISAFDLRYGTLMIDGASFRWYIWSVGHKFDSRWISFL